jgi:hypothetical protein
MCLIRLIKRIFFAKMLNFHSTLVEVKFYSTFVEIILNL